MSNLTTKLALKKLGIPSNAFDNISNPFAGNNKNSSKSRPTDGSNPGLDETDDKEDGKNWPAWMQIKNLPLTVQPWLTPAPPPVPVAEPPKVGDLAPLDREGRLVLGQGKRTLVVFLRCVGCAFAKQTFLALRTLSNRYAGVLHCIAVSHSSPAATSKWLDMLGGAWNISIVIDEKRELYAAWGLRTSSAWYVLNPATQVASWKAQGWMGERVATAVKKGDEVDKKAREIRARRAAAAAGKKKNKTKAQGEGDEKDGADGDEEGPVTTMGNKWQQAGSWATDQRGTIIWGGPAKSADDVMDLDAGVRALGF